MVSRTTKTVLVTGANGFIGQNLVVRLRETANISVITFTRKENLKSLTGLVKKVDIIIHLAGVNRPDNDTEFNFVNVDLTMAVCDAIRGSGRNIAILFASSVQSNQPTPYGQSKKLAEQTLELFAEETGNPVSIFRLPGVFGKWCKPNYNSVVATFCHNIARDIPIQISDSKINMDLVYIDDVVNIFIDKLFHMNQGVEWSQVDPIYNLTLGELVEQIRCFDECRTSLISERVGKGMVRALYSTYISHLPKKNFVYNLPSYSDERGMFVEMLKTHDSGQFSYFTINLGVTRGAHYHHTKTEKFLTVKGTVRMRFRRLSDGEHFEVVVDSKIPQIVDSIPGWVHDITNIGNDEAIVMLWANEIFDREKPDCVSCEV